MKDYRFYAEFATNKEKRQWNREKLRESRNFRNCVAVYISTYFEQLRATNSLECVGSVQDIPNNPCAWSQCSLKYLQDQCIRISEKLARKLHPNLFKYLE